MQVKLAWSGGWDNIVDVLVRMINIFIMLGAPLALAAFLVRRYKVEWSIFFLGAGTFLLSQITEIPFNRVVLLPFVESLLDKREGFAPMFLFALSAGVFEESWRYIFFRFGMRKGRSWDRALLFGSGHGGLEAMLLGVVTLFGLFQAIAYRDIDLSTILPLDQLEIARARLDIFWSLPWYAAILGALERVFALVIHIALSAMMLQVFTRRKISWLFLAVGWHTIVDVVVIYGTQTWSVYAVEGGIGVMALLSLGIILLLRTPARVENGASSLAAPSDERVPLGVVEQPISRERLDESRYTEGG
jgi:uncharacterized membrane protein YhfC